MRRASLRNFDVAIVVLVLLVFPGPAHSQECSKACTRGRAVCTMQAHTALAACLQSCASGDVPCRSSCLSGSRAALAACRAARVDCATSCLSPASRSRSCAAGCSATARACFADAFAGGTTCVQSCKAAGKPGIESCLERCAAALGGNGPTCLAAFQGCLGACQGQPAGACFSTMALACTAEPCGPGLPCSKPNEFCSERCSTPPSSGTCFDVDQHECTDQACAPAQPCPEAGQTCVPICPLPAPHGRCFDPTTEECTDQPCDLTRRCALANQICTLQCPMRTPVPQCTSVPCGGPCAISPICPPGGVCPKAVFPSRPGQCTSDADGNCACVPISPPPTRTPRPTPTAQCEGEVCGGPCTISVPFPCPADHVSSRPGDPGPGGAVHARSERQLRVRSLDSHAAAHPDAPMWRRHVRGSVRDLSRVPAGRGVPRVSALWTVYVGRGRELRVRARRTANADARMRDRCRLRRRQSLYGRPLCERRVRARLHLRDGGRRTALLLGTFGVVCRPVRFRFDRNVRRVVSVRFDVRGLAHLGRGVRMRLGSRRTLRWQPLRPHAHLRAGARLPSDATRRDRLL